VEAFPIGICVFNWIKVLNVALFILLSLCEKQMNTGSFNFSSFLF